MPLDEEENAQLVECAKNLRSIIEGAEMEMKAENQLERAFAGDNLGSANA
jgi:hypothetical protein